MLCDKCGKNNASVFFKQVINDKETTMHLCDQCANEVMDIGNFSLDKFFNDFGSSYFSSSETPFLGSDYGSVGNGSLKCPVCGMSYGDFSRSGKLGCSECYSTFANRILPVVKSIHGRNKHVGKIKDSCCQCADTNNKKTLSEEEQSKFYEKMALQKQLQELIKSEKFEEAATVRDKIKAIESELQNGLNEKQDK